VKVSIQKIRTIYSLITATVILFIPSCRIDHGLEPMYSKIMGKVIFTGEIPRHTNEVRVAVVKSFPPSDMAELLFSERLSLDSDTARYEIYLAPGKYDIVAVIWKEYNYPWNLSDIVGLYGGLFIGDQLVPIYQSIEIEDNNTVLDDVDINANLNRVNRDSKIEGTVYFKGAWPENTGMVGVGAFIDIPNPGDLEDYYLKNVDIDYGLSTFVDSADYQLRVHSTDTLKYISALWLSNDYDFNQIKDIGFFADPSDTNQPGMIIPPLDSVLSGINITVYFE
jgi:hypothetical protein